jgi:hypothetical protein
MDNRIQNVLTPVALNRPQPTVKKEPIAASSPPPTLTEPVRESVDAEKLRLEDLTRAAQNYPPDPYVVSDRTFTIFKDATGQYVVRYRSLRDGKITYVPEPAILPYQIQNAGRGSLIEIKV